MRRRITKQSGQHMACTPVCKPALAPTFCTRRADGAGEQRRARRLHPGGHAGSFTQQGAGRLSRRRRAHSHPSDLVTQYDKARCLFGRVQRGQCASSCWVGGKLGMEHRLHTSTSSAAGRPVLASTVTV